MRALSIRTIGRLRMHAIIAAAACACMAMTIAHASTDAFKVSGSATRKIDQASQQGNAFALKAYLSPKASLSTPVQEGGSFAMLGKLALAPSACYADTIFRDDFDGDGLRVDR